VANRFVEKLHGFVPFSEAGVAALTLATANARKVGPRQDLIREGDKPGPIFVILEGWACRYKILPNGLRQVLAFLMPGDCCDIHVDLLEEMDHSIATITPCVVAKIERETVNAILDDHPGVMRALYLNQLIDEGTLRAWMTSMGRRASIERVAHLMCELHLRARNIGINESDSLRMPLAQSLLADALGMTAVHINRVLKQLRLAGAMEIKRGMLIISDPVKLIKVAGFDENYLHRRLRKVA